MEPECRGGPRAGERYKCDGISVGSLITAAARALATGDPVGALLAENSSIHTSRSPAV